MSEEKAIVLPELDPESQSQLEKLEKNEKVDGDSCASHSLPEQKAGATVRSTTMPKAGLAARLKSTRKPGLADRLSALGKKKESVLTKSLKDWQQLKEEEGLVEELAEHTKSKDSFVERQAFLQRADLRQFEQEKSIRDKIRARNSQP